MTIAIARRKLLAAFAGAAAWPLAARAQQAGHIYRLGFLIPSGRETLGVADFFDELRLNGFIEGQNLTVIPKGFAVRNDQLAERAAALLKAAPDAIVGGPELPLRALQALTRTIPLISMTEDMVATGLVASLARPGGNTTGISLLSHELDGKRQDILIEAVPGARRMAALFDSNVTPKGHIQTLQDAARARGVDLFAYGVAGIDEIAPAIDTGQAAGAKALNFLASGLFFPVSRVVIERAAVARLPGIYHWPEAADAGGVLAYGPRLSQVWRQRARLVIKILRGTSPADIPVEQPTNFELVINLRAAKAIGHEVPAGLVLRADKVIE
jgi:putative ABC transport system substrate-binding protein